MCAGCCWIGRPYPALAVQCRDVVMILALGNPLAVSYVAVPELRCAGSVVPCCTVSPCCVCSRVHMHSWGANLRKHWGWQLAGRACLAPCVHRGPFLGCWVRQTSAMACSVWTNPLSVWMTPPLWFFPVAECRRHGLFRWPANAADMAYNLADSQSGAWLQAALKHIVGVQRGSWLPERYSSACFCGACGFRRPLLSQKALFHAAVALVMRVHRKFMLLLFFFF